MQRVLQVRPTGPRVDGGAVNTWQREYGGVDVNRILFDDGPAYIAIPPGGDGWGDPYEPSYGVWRDLAASILREARYDAMAAAQAMDIDNDFILTIRVSFESENEAYQSLPPFRLNDANINTIIEGLDTAQEGALKSDESVVLNRSLRITFIARPAMAADENGNGGCSPDFEWECDGLKSAPDGACFIACLAYFVQASECYNTLAKVRCKLEKARKDQISSLDVPLVQKVFRVIQRKVPLDYPTDWVENPVLATTAFFEAGYKLRIRLLAFNDETSTWDDPLFFGDEAWPTYTIVRRLKHFYYVFNDTSFDQARDRVQGAHKIQIGQHSAYHVKPKKQRKRRGANDPCLSCGRMECPKMGKRKSGLRRCKNCETWCVNNECLLLHTTLCDKEVECRDCGAVFDTVQRRQMHQCAGQNWKDMWNEGRVPAIPRGFLAYDLEAAQTPEGYHVPVCLCVSAYAFSEEYTSNCEEGAPPGEWHEIDVDDIDEEIQRTQYIGEDCCEQFAIDLVENKKWKGYVAAAHNGSKYDGRFLLTAMIRKGFTDVDITMDGTAVKALVKEGDSRKQKEEGEARDFHDVFVIDSLSFLLSSLRKAASSYDIAETKTFFSFTELNKWYEAGMPADHVLDGPPPVDAFPAKDRGKDLDAFLLSKAGKPYDFTKELLEYCQVDTDVLLKIMLKYTEKFSTMAYDLAVSTNKPAWLIPFAQRTLASASMSMFKALMYDRENFPLCTSPKELEDCENNVKDVATWLWYKQHTLGIHIDGVHQNWSKRHVLIPNTNIQVHGYSLTPVKRAFWMCFCAQVGCAECHPGESQLLAAHKTKDNRSRFELEADRLDKQQLLEEMGFEFVQVRKCEFRTLQGIDEFKMIRKEARDDIKRTGILNVRRAYKGGRVEPFALYYKCRPGEVLRSFDVVSLYPSVMTGMYRYPVGKPVVLRAGADPVVAQEFADCVARQDISRYFGIMRCRILVNRTRLHHPLVQRHYVKTPTGSIKDEKLLAGACQACGDRPRLAVCECDHVLFCADCIEQEKAKCHHIRCCTDHMLEDQERPCNHTESEREFWIEATTPEIQHALRLDPPDTLLEISEVHHFPDAMGPLPNHQFGDFIFHLYKVKEAASPLDGIEDLEAHCRKIDEGSRRVFGKPMGLTPADLQPNKGRRQVAKITLNSFYGKFATKPIRKSTALLKSREDLEKIVGENPTATTLHMIIQGATDDDVPVTVATIESVTSAVGILNTTNVYIAAFVTAYGRLKLFDKINEMGKRALYCDTDSVLVVCNANDPLPPWCGSFLGDWDHEGGPDSKDSTEFASLGPKVYTLKRLNGKPYIRAKGIAGASVDLLNTDTFKDMLVGKDASKYNVIDQMWYRKDESRPGQNGYGVKVTKTGRISRVTASKRVTQRPFEFDDDGTTLQAILTKPFGFVK